MNMKTLLISLVSDQTLPNVQLIKEFKKEVTDYLFISTEKMEKRDADYGLVRQLQLMMRVVECFTFW